MHRHVALAMAFVVALIVPASARAEQPKAKKSTAVLAHVKLSGDMGEQAPPEADLFGGGAQETFKTTIDRLKKAASDKEVSAVLLEIDGLRVGWGKAHELAQAVARVRSGGKKVYAYVQSGTTRDYALALACDEIAMPESASLML